MYRTVVIIGKRTLLHFPVAPQSAFISVPCHRHYLRTLQTSLGQQLDSCAAQTVVCVHPRKACYLANLEQEIVSHGFLRVPARVWNFQRGAPFKYC